MSWLVLKCFIADKIDFSTEVSTYKVHEICKEKPNYHKTFDVIWKEVNCSCHMFEFMAILCRHSLNLFIKINVYSFSTQYLLRRLTINAKKEQIKWLEIDELHEGRNKYSSTYLFNSVMVYSLELSERASRSPKHHDITIQALKKVIAELDQLDLEESKEELNNLTFDVISKVYNNNITLCDPPLRETKGCPRTLRMKGSLELLKTVSSTCSYCKKRATTNINVRV